MVAEIIISIFLVICFGGFYYFSHITHVIAHEETHESINNMYHCEDSVITYDRLHMSGQTECTPTKETNEHIEEFRMLHSMNEIIGYNVVSIMITLFMVCTLICVTIIIHSKR